MKLFKKSLLTLMMVIGLAIGASAQSGWNTGQWYQYQGQSWTEWKDVFIGYNAWGSHIYQRQCRNTVWYSETYNGYAYVWGPSGWYTQWYSGYAWKCYWSGWYLC